MSVTSWDYDSVLLPNGQEFLVHMDYTTSQARAVQTLIVVSSISLIAVVSLLITVAVVAILSVRSSVENVFIRSHVAAYFVSLLVSDVFQAVGSIMNLKWVQNDSVDAGDFCTAQGAIKMVADIGIALWTLTIAIHTFNVLFLRIHVGKYVLAMALIAGWSFIVIMVMLGPSALDTEQNGPFFGISGYWCWITDGYPVSRIVQDYMFMFISAFFSFVLYTLIFLRLRGNIVVADGRIRFCRVTPSTAWQAQSRQTPYDARLTTITKQMLLYPIAYTILIVPIAACRFAEWTGHQVPFAAVIFSDAVFLLSGFVNTILFVTTRRILPMHSILPHFMQRGLRLSAPLQPPTTKTFMQDNSSTLHPDTPRMAPHAQPSPKATSSPPSSFTSRSPRTPRRAHSSMSIDSQVPLIPSGVEDTPPPAMRTRPLPPLPSPLNGDEHDLTNKGREAYLLPGSERASGL